MLLPVPGQQTWLVVVALFACMARLPPTGSSFVNSQSHMIPYGPCISTRLVLGPFGRQRKNGDLPKPDTQSPAPCLFPDRSSGCSVKNQPVIHRACLHNARTFPPGQASGHSALRLGAPPPLAHHRLKRACHKSSNRLVALRDPLPVVPPRSYRPKRRNGTSTSTSHTLHTHTSQQLLPQLLSLSCCPCYKGLPHAATTCCCLTLPLLTPCTGCRPPGAPRTSPRWGSPCCRPRT